VIDIGHAQIFKTLLFILFPISIDVFRRGTPCIRTNIKFVCVFGL